MSGSKNVIQDLLIAELVEREGELTEELGEAEKTLGRTIGLLEKTRLKARANAIAKELTDIDEVLRLLEAR